jgi:hypothetical protein
MTQTLRTPEPEGFRYLPDYLSANEELEMLERLEGLSFQQGAHAWRRGEAAGITLRLAVWI